MPYFRLAKYINKACAIVIGWEREKKKKRKDQWGELKGKRKLVRRKWM